MHQTKHQKFVERQILQANSGEEIPLALLITVSSFVQLSRWVVD